MNAKTIILINFPLLLLSFQVFPVQAASVPDALEMEQQQFLSSQTQLEPAKLEAEQDRFLKGLNPQPESQRQSSINPRWERSTAKYQALPEREPQSARTETAIIPAEPVGNLDPAPSAPMEPQAPPTRAAFIPPKKLPSLTTSDGYSRVTPLRTAQTPQNLPLTPPSPSLVVVPTTNPPKIAFALPPSLDSFLYRIELGTEQMLYPLIHPFAITSGFGWRVHPIFGSPRFHAGIDLGAPVGSPVLAAFTGTVVSADWMSGYGNAVLLQHGSGLRSLYGHLSRLMVRPGQTVMQGTVIGLSGSTGNSTGPHLHFEMRRFTGGEWVAFDPGHDLKAAQRELASALKSLEQRQASVLNQ